MTIGRGLRRLSSFLMDRPSVIFVLGPPGSGKGTQCDFLSNKYNLVHLSAGELLRAERNSGSSVADEIEYYMKEGLIVPPKVTVGLLEKEMKKLGWNKFFLIDGFPRNEQNLECWLKNMSQRVDIMMGVWIDVAEETSVQRILARYNNSTRIDDNVESLKKRWQCYNIETRPMLNILKKICPVKIIDGARPINMVSECINTAFLEIKHTEG